jgi:hypothetical protein
MLDLIDHHSAIEVCRDLIETSQLLFPKRSAEEHLDHAAAAASALIGNCPDPWLQAALEIAAGQLRMVAQ